MKKCFCCVILLCFLLGQLATAQAESAAVSIRITIGSHVIHAELDDNATSRELLGKLPQTISMTRIGGGREFYGTLEGDTLSYQEDAVQTTFENGDLAYWFSGNGLCLMYNNQAEHPTVDSGIVIIGRMTSDFSLLATLEDAIEFASANGRR